MTERDEHRNNRRRWIALAAAAAVILTYLGTYAALRQSHVLLRTGYFYNAHLPTGGLAPEAGWRDHHIRLRSRSAWARITEAVFWPAIRLELALHNVQPREPGT